MRPALARPTPLRAVATLVAVALTLLPLAPAAAMDPIEGIPGYTPQSTCSPRPKPGTVQLAEYLMKRYPGSGSSGISRSCSSSGVSEHKEGRAFDWRLSASRARDRRYARDFISRLMATDRAGNERALARRMGIMYVIWNDHIWSASVSYRKRDYLHAACKSLEKCSATLRHRDHMHISLTWAGARAKTSWYQHRSKTKTNAKPETKPKPKPQTPKLPEGVLDLDRRPISRVRVPTDGTTLETGFKLLEGRTYKITAAGLYGYGGPQKVADASCVWSKRKAEWTPGPNGRKGRATRLDLAVDGDNVFGSTCRRSHVYVAHYTATATKPLRLRVVGRHAEATGPLTVLVSRRSTSVAKRLPSYPDPSAAPTGRPRKKDGYGLIAERVEVPARGRSVWTRRALTPGVAYRVTVSGKVDLGGGVLSDGQCVEMAGGWYRQGSLDLRNPAADHGNLYVDGVPFHARGGCTTRTHTTTLTATRAGRLRLALWNPYGRRAGGDALTVMVQRLTEIATPRAARPAKVRKTEKWTQHRDWFQVATDDPDGTVSRMRLVKGERVQVFVKGTHRSNGYTADASCVETADGWVPRDPDVALEQDPLDVWVDGQAVTWRSVGRDDTCSTDQHTYVTWFTATKNGPIRLSVLDLDHRDNGGKLDVTLFRE